MAFNVSSEVNDSIARITLAGELDAGSAPQFKTEIEKVAGPNIQRLVLLVGDLEYIASAGLRILIFAKQKMGPAVDIYVVNAQEQVMSTLVKTGFHHSVILVDAYDPATVGTV